MAINTETILAYGDTDASGGLAALEGTPKEFADLDYNATTPIKSPQSGMIRKCILVKNDSSVTLARGQAVTFKAAHYGKRIGAVGTTADVAAGFVPDCLTAGVADGAHFWLQVSGPIQVISDGATTIAQGDRLITSTSGKVTETDTTPSSVDVEFIERVSEVGVAMEAATNVDGTRFRAFVKCPLSF